MVELALSIPFLLLSLLAIIYFGRYFYTQQVLTYAAQETARTAARTPNLADAEVRDAIRGFSTDGSLLGSDDESNPSPAYRILSAARMLNQEGGTKGGLPPGAEITISPWDDSSANNTDIVTVKIKFPFGLMVSNQTGEKPAEFGEVVNVWTGEDGAPVSFQNNPQLGLEAKASCPQEIFQQ